MPNEDGKLRISMTAQVSIIVNAVKQVLIVPSTALGERNAQGQYKVLVLGKDNTTTDKWVDVGLNTNINAEVKSGLSEGEQVVVSQSTDASKTTSGRRMGPPM